MVKLTKNIFKKMKKEICSDVSYYDDVDFGSLFPSPFSDIDPETFLLSIYPYIKYFPIEVLRDLLSTYGDRIRSHTKLIEKAKLYHNTLIDYFQIFAFAIHLANGYPLNEEDSATLYRLSKIYELRNFFLRMTPGRVS